MLWYYDDDVKSKSSLCASRLSFSFSVYFFLFQKISAISVLKWQSEELKNENVMDFPLLWHEIIIFQREKKVFPSLEFYARDLVRSSSCGWTFDSEINWQKLCLSLGALRLRVGWIRTKLVLVSLSIHPLFWGAKTRFVRPHHWQKRTNKQDHAGGIICEKVFQFIRKSWAAVRDRMRMMKEKPSTTTN